MLICTAITRSESALQSKPTRDREGTETMRTMLATPASTWSSSVVCERVRVPPCEARLSPDTTPYLLSTSAGKVEGRGYIHSHMHALLTELGMLVRGQRYGYMHVYYINLIRNDLLNLAGDNFEKWRRKKIVYNPSLGVKHRPTATRTSTRPTSY